MFFVVELTELSVSDDVYPEAAEALAAMDSDRHKMVWKLLEALPYVDSVDLICGPGWHNYKLAYDRQG